MANDPKIDCRVKLVLSMPNTNLLELKRNMLLNFTFKERVVENFGDARRSVRETPDWENWGTVPLFGFFSHRG